MFQNFSKQKHDCYLIKALCTSICCCAHIIKGLLFRYSKQIFDDRLQQHFMQYPQNKNNNNRSAVTLFRCLAAMLPEGSTRAEILPGCPSLDRGSREAEVGFEPRTFRSVNSRSNHLGHIALKRLQLWLFRKTLWWLLRRLWSVKYVRNVSNNDELISSELSLFSVSFDEFKENGCTMSRYFSIHEANSTQTAGSCSRFPVYDLLATDFFEVQVLNKQTVGTKGN
ncbi:hypothetical protein CSKR_108873 [Clonorchis sinensis]|uniref:Uncharacterized protein n=1 Tax=Clonorchis sinensis TaxID=79923 RepID=A0A3R7CQZ3_CLOSI|nr:hypothetical protein CSKR_108873 [Clonorchis sinensis]